MSYKVYPEYKHSEIEWIHQLPNHWKVGRIKNIAQLNPSKSEVSHLPADTKVTFLPMEVIGEDGTLSTSRTKEISESISGYTYLTEGDVITAKITPCFENNKGCIAKGLTNSIAFATTEVVPIRPNKETCTEFLYFLIHSNPFRDVAEGSMYGAGGQKRVSDTFIAEYHAALPPLTEQRAIAAFLDRECGKMDALVEKQQKLIALLKEKRQAVITQAVTKGMVNGEFGMLNPHLSTPDKPIFTTHSSPLNPSNIQWLGDIPQGWKISQPRFNISHSGGGTPSKDNTSFWNGDIPWVSPKDMKVENISTSMDKITLEAVQNSSAKLIPTNSILIVVRGMILLHSVPVATTLVPVTVNQDMKAIVCRKELDHKYFHKLLTGLKSRILDLVDSSAHGTRCLKFDEFLRMAIPLPPLPEQHSIVAYLDSACGKIDSLISKAEQAIVLLKERRTALISAAVTGKIDVRDEVPEGESEEEKG